MNEPDVICVDPEDNVIGYMPKQKAHELGVLHRAISVFITNSNGEWLLQRRADHKYHSPGLWSNTCCSHPYRDESEQAAAERRLMEEMGIKTQITKVHAFKYKAEFDNGLIEHEYDHIFSGISDHTPVINTEEVSQYRYISLEQLEAEMQDSPESFTAWFKLLFDE